MWWFNRKPAYRVLNQITIDSQALVANYRYFAKLNPQAVIAPVLKSNAYGHGLVGTARCIQKYLSVPFVCCDSLYEAYELDKAHLHLPKLIMGYTFPENYAVHHINAAFAVFDTTTLTALNTYQPGSRIHIKIDTGMNRYGLLPDEIPAFIAQLKRCPRLQVEGIFSHLSQADTSKVYTQKQIAQFKTMTAQFEAAGFSFKYKHLAATGGASWITDPYFNLIRLGIGFYGYSPFGPQTTIGKTQRKQLKPALSLYSHITQIKIIPTGSRVGYGGTAVVNEPTTIGILPLGYADGLQRTLSNKGVLTLANGEKSPILGRVSMNITTVKLPLHSTVKVGDAVSLIDTHPLAINSVYKYAQLDGTIPYTVLTGLNPTIRRVFL